MDKQELLTQNIQSFLEIYNAVDRPTVKITALLSLYRNLQEFKKGVENQEFESRYGTLYKNVQAKMKSISDVKLHSRFLESLKKLSTSS